jgi:hypothetical protein
VKIVDCSQGEQLRTRSVDGISTWKDGEEEETASGNDTVRATGYD